MTEVAATEEVLNLSLDGWEGPLDLLLALARAQKVDLAKLSIATLVDQYLAFVARARRLRLELAADYLVMAAWLAYLKSCLLLPPDPEADPDPQLLAEQLAWRLQRLDAMREAGARLMARDLVGRDVFVRASPEGLRVVRRSAYDATLYELMAAYADLRARGDRRTYVPARRPVCPLDAALERMSGLLGRALDWTALSAWLPPASDPDYRRSALASHFAAVLELAKQGRADIAQPEPFGPLLVRARR